MAKFPYIIGKWAQGYIMHQQRMILNGLQYFSGLPSWVQNKASLSFNAEWAEYYNDYETNKLYFRDANFNRVAATFSRTSSATRVNKQGLIETVATGIPRIDYSDGSAKLLMEPARTNGVLNSENFSGTGFVATLGTVSLNQAIAPNGALTADLFTKTSAVNTVSEVYSNGNYATTGVHTMSVFVKKNTGNTILLRLDRGGNTANASFNIDTLTFTNSGANIISSSYVDYGDGWYRLIVTGNILSTAWGISWCNLFTNPTNDSFYIWGAQVEAGSYPTSYIPTAGSAVTRNADSSLTTGLSSYIGQTEGVLFTAGSGLKFSQELTSINRSTNNSVFIRTRASTLQIQATAYSDSVLYNIINPAVLTNGIYRTAVAYGNANIRQCTNGGSVLSNTSNTWTPNVTMDSLNINVGGYVAAQEQAFYDKIIIFPTALTNSELQQLTS